MTSSRQMRAYVYYNTVEHSSQGNYDEHHNSAQDKCHYVTVFLGKTYGETMKKHIPYHAYLIRLWPSKRNGLAGHRVSLESVATGERKNFPDLESLFAFLKTQQEQNPAGPEAPSVNRHRGGIS
jgi:hypothetical protein